MRQSTALTKGMTILTRRTKNEELAETASFQQRSRRYVIALLAFADSSIGSKAAAVVIESAAARFASRRELFS
jgi:hypothetical protein